MKMASKVAIWMSIILATITAAAPYSSTYNYGFDAGNLVKRQTQQPIIVSRLPSINGTVPARPEIREMKQNPYKWNLFLLSMSMLQYTDQNDQLSWKVFMAFLSPRGMASQAPQGLMTEVTAPTCLSCFRHGTAFIFLFMRLDDSLPVPRYNLLTPRQQVIFRLIQMIASWFTDPIERAVYRAAATEFRIPYWDWAMTPPPGESTFMPEFEAPGIQVYGPNGWQFIANPLHSYKFRPLDPEVFSEGDFPTWTETKRAPFETMDNRSIAHAIDHARPALQERLYILLSNYKDYGPFSNKYWSTATNQSQFDSVEALHDAMHVLVGNRGHMFYIQYSAFDPIFFLHHTMIDRVVMMWQALNPTSWVTPQVGMEHSFTMPPGEIQNITTDLKPFYANASGGFWNSAMARDTLPFGYSYAETTPVQEKWSSEDRARLIETINRLYGSSSPSSLSQKRRRILPRRGGEAISQIRKGIVLDEAVTDFLEGPDVVTKSINEGNLYTEWIANVHVSNGALNGSFAIHFFLGQVPRDIGLWLVAPSLVGSMNVFAMKNMGTGHHMSGTVPLTSALMRMVSAGRIKGLGLDHVKPFLQAFLQVRIVGEDGVEVDVNSLKSLYVHIVSSQVQEARHAWELPSWGPVIERFKLKISQ
nr:tyrosinase precursor [Colletotrichum truncatum]KAF6795274.1 tyrosinase precursor [Colletotrichum truncatum]